jgi:hypothetical protein
MVKTYLGSLVPKDQIAFLKYIWLLKLGISELLGPIQRAHTYSNNPQIVGYERHQFLAFGRKGTGNFCIGEVMELLLHSRHHRLVHSERHKSGSVGHSKEEAVKLGSLVTLRLPVLPSHPHCSRRFPAPWFINLDLSYHYGNVTQPRELPL